MDIIAIQPPIDIGVDAKNRAMFSTNYRSAVSLSSGLIEQEILTHLQSKGLCILGSSSVIGTAFYGSKAIIPDGAGPYVLLKLTGGYGPDFTHSEEVLINITFQIVTYSIIYDVSLLRSWQIHTELNGKRDLRIEL
jgi:hypothetical protein